MKKQTIITDYFYKKKNIVYGYNKDTGSWHCVSCGEDMGQGNPRQYCCKSYCSR